MSAFGLWGWSRVVLHQERDKYFQGRLYAKLLRCFIIHVWMSWKAPQCIITVKQKKWYFTRGKLKTVRVFGRKWDLLLQGRVLEAMGASYQQFGGSNGLLDALANILWILAIYRVCNHGGLGRMEEAKNGLAGEILLELERENLKEINCMVYFLLGKGLCYIFILIFIFSQQLFICSRVTIAKCPCWELSPGI